MKEKTGRVIALGLGQAIAWASSYYLPAIIAVAIAADLHVSPAWIYAGLTFGLVITAFVGPQVGRWIDRGHGRYVLCGSNLLFATGLCLMAVSTGISSFFFAWLVLGLAMGAGLYDPAFATLTVMYGHGARPAITGITLIAGFASTFGWPISAALLHRVDWRGTCVAWALLHVTLGLGVNAWAARTAQLRSKHQTDTSNEAAATHSTVRFTRADMILAVFLVATGVVTAGIATQLPRILMTLGASSAAAIGFAALMGPAQVAARILEFSFFRHQHPLVSARLAAALHPIGVALFAIVGTPALALLAIVHGAGNGLVTIARGTLPLALFGPIGYGARVGRIAAPSRVMQAFAPLVFGAAIDHIGGKILWISSGLSLIAVACLCLLDSTGSESAAALPRHPARSRSEGTRNY